MHNADSIGKAMGAIIAPSGIILTDPDQVDEHVKRQLGEFGINPDDVFAVGNDILNGAVAMGQDPETTVVQAFVMGVTIGAYLANMPEGQ